MGPLEPSGKWLDINNNALSKLRNLFTFDIR